MVVWYNNFDFCKINGIAQWLGVKLIQTKTLKEKKVRNTNIQLYQQGSIYVLKIDDIGISYLTMKDGNAAYKRAYMLLSKGLTPDEVLEDIYEE